MLLSFLAALMLDTIVADTMKVDTLVADTAKVDTLVADTAKVDSGFVFTTVDSVAITPVKDQHRSGTCWAFSTLGFLESEVLRAKGVEVDFAEMYVVSKTMMDRATYCVRMYNDVKFAAGGSAYDVIYCMKHYGLVPQAVMPGIRYGSTPADTLPVHAELDRVANGYLNALTGLKKLTPVWREGLQAIYDTYLGKCPREFLYEGQMYTPLTYVESLGLNADDYVSLTSYTHHPFYQTFALEVPDNWRMDQMYNLPIDELMEVIDSAIANGYTLAWGADVSEVGFTRKGIGVMPLEEKGADITGSDMAKWVGMSKDEQKAKLTEKPLPEKEITQEMRQQAYDNWETTDDHGMQIFGIAKDQNGKKYYMVKNSWGTVKSNYKGIWYISEAFMRYKTNDVLVNKNAIPEDIRKKLGI
jgi:aminopeptidase C